MYICLFVYLNACFPLRYADLISKAQERHAKLEESMKKNAMLREAKEIEAWLEDTVSGILLLIYS